jgi:hypothetical protein
MPAPMMMTGMCGTEVMAMCVVQSVRTADLEAGGFGPILAEWPFSHDATPAFSDLTSDPISAHHDFMSHVQYLLVGNTCD